MFKIIQKGSGTLLTPTQLDQLKIRYEVIISGNGDCLFGAAFRGILEIYDKPEVVDFPVNPFDFFEDKSVVIYELLQSRDLSSYYSDYNFQIAVRNFRRYIYDCLIEFLKTKDYNAIFEVFSYATIYEFFNFVYDRPSEDNLDRFVNKFFELFTYEDNYYRYTGSVSKKLEEEFIDISITHFIKMKLERNGIDVFLDPEYYGGQLEQTAISYLFNVIFYQVNDRITKEISSEPTGNPLVSIDRVIPILYTGGHYNAIKLDFIESGYFADIKEEHKNIHIGRPQYISDRTIRKLTDIGKKGFIQSVKPVSSRGDVPSVKSTTYFARPTSDSSRGQSVKPVSSRGDVPSVKSRSMLHQDDSKKTTMNFGRPTSDSSRGQSMKSTTTYPIITQPANPVKLSQKEKEFNEIINNFDLILEKLKKIKKFGDIYHKTIYDNFIEKISLYTFYQGKDTLKKDRLGILKKSKSPLTSFIKSLIEKIDSSSPSFKFDMVTDFVDISELAFNILNDCENFKQSGLAQDKLNKLMVIRYKLSSCEILFILTEI